MSFANLKKNRKSAIDALVNKAQSAAGGGEKKGYGDDRFWKPTRDKAGNGYAVIRFMPAPEGEATPWVQYWDHGFQGPTGQWYIEKSLTSIGQDDPVSEYNSKLWNSGHDEDKEIARKQKRRLHYVANVLVVSDPANPENEGKVFLFQFGKKIFEKIMDVMQPQFADEEPVNPFDFWEGADFKLKIRKVEGYVNYDKSEFAAPSELFEGDEDKLEKLYNSLYSLKEYVDPKNFKTYDELKQKLYRVLGEASAVTTKEKVEIDEVAPAPKMKTAEEIVTASDDNDDDPMSYFAKMTQD